MNDHAGMACSSTDAKQRIKGVSPRLPLAAVCGVLLVRQLLRSISPVRRHLQRLHLPLQRVLRQRSSLRNATRTRVAAQGQALAQSQRCPLMPRAPRQPCFCALESSGKDSGRTTNSHCLLLHMQAGQL